MTTPVQFDVVSEPALFDLELEALPFAATPKDVIACKECRRPIPKAERSLMLAWSSGVGYYWTCEKCVQERWQRAYDAEPWWPCGVHKTYFDDIAHCEDCLHGVCPSCSIDERTGYHLWANHSPKLDDGDTCYWLKHMYERVASCVQCHGWTWGDYDHHVVQWHVKKRAA